MFWYKLQGLRPEQGHLLLIVVSVATSYQPEYNNTVNKLANRWTNTLTLSKKIWKLRLPETCFSQATSLFFCYTEVSVPFYRNCSLGWDTKHALVFVLSVQNCRNWKYKYNVIHCCKTVALPLNNSFIRSDFSKTIKFICIITVWIIFSEYAVIRQPTMCHPLVYSKHS